MAKKSNIDIPKITVRRRKLRTDTYALYLDIFYKGTRTRENLELYIIPEETKKDKLHNQNAYAMAAKIRDERELQIMNPEEDSEIKFNPDMPFLEYFRQVMERIREKYSVSVFKNWYNSYNYVKRYCNETTTFNDVTPEWCENFKTYLDQVESYSHMTSRNIHSQDFKGLSNRTKNEYLDKLRHCIKSAFEENIILTNPMKDVQNYSKDAKTLVVLTWDEVKRLDDTPCLKPTLKNIFLLSCFTGIRRTALVKIKWSDVDDSGEEMTITVPDKTPVGYKVIVPAQAMKYLGQRGKDDELVFPDFKYATFLYVELRQWALDAGVMKDITFNTARHTFAVLMLQFGADIYTVTSMLGNTSTTNMDIYQTLATTNKK